MTALTRLPSGRRASTIGLDSSTRRPTRATILSIVRRRWASSVNAPSTWWIAPGPLDVDRVGAVDHDLGDVGVAQVGLERAVAEDVVGDLLGDAGAVGDGQRRLVLGEHLLQRLAHLLLELGLGEPRVVELGAEVVQQRLVHRALEVGERVDDCGAAAARQPSSAVALVGVAASTPRSRWAAASRSARLMGLRLPAQQAAPVGAQLRSGCRSSEPPWRGSDVALGERLDGQAHRVLGVVEDDRDAAVDRGRDVAGARDLQPRSGP